MKESVFSGLDIAGMHLANRIVVPPMATDQADADGIPGVSSAAHYRDLAATGAALVIVEHAYVAPEGRSSPQQMSIATDATLPGHAAIAAAIRSAGARCVAQISHAGANRRPGMPGRFLGPSAVEHPFAHHVPEEMTAREIAETVRAFGAAAARVKKAGYDAVEIHCAHGYLLNQFLSPLTNRRSDAYGGTPANRRRFILEVIEEVRAATGSTMPLFLRLAVADNPPQLELYPGGLSIADGVANAVAFEDAGIDVLDLSGGICGSRPAAAGAEAYYRPFAAAVSARVHCPVICTGGITRAATAQEIIASGDADLVGVGRALAADHTWVRRARTEAGLPA